MVTLRKLELLGEENEEKKVVKYLGDYFNSKGGNSDLVDKSIGSITSTITDIIAFCRELSLGNFEIHIMLQLYESIFLSKLLFNSQSWSRIKKKELEDLQTRPIKDVKASHENAVHNTYSWYFPRTRFLHHILNLDEKDPVFRIYKEQQEFINEPNWSNEIITIRQLYSLNYKDSEIKTFSKVKWRNIVKKSIRNYAYKELTSLAQCKTKTKEIPKHLSTESTYVQQSYILKLPTKVARRAFKELSK